jgi:WxL domain surface cell wall-binding
MARMLRHALVAVFALVTLVVPVATVGAASATATFTAGSLSITAPPANFSYSGTLTGDVLNLNSSFAVGVTDATGSKAGWNLQASIGVLTKVTDTIPAANHTITGVTVSGVKGTAPTNNIALGAIPTTTAKIYNAAANTGMGQSTMTFATQLAVPADAAAGSYSATLTVTIVSGP